MNATTLPKLRASFLNKNNNIHNLTINLQFYWFTARPFYYFILVNKNQSEQTHQQSHRC